MKRSSFIVLASFLVLLVMGLGWFSLAAGFFHRSTPSKPVQIYFADNISRSLQLVIEEFNRLHRGAIEVVPVDLPFDKFSTNERKELLARSLRSKSEKLDVFAVDLIWIPRFARWSEPLEKYFTQEERERLLASALGPCYYDSSLVAAPLYGDIGLMYYRRDIIRRLPDADAVERRLQQSITWDEMIDLRRRLHYENKPFYIYQAKAYEGLVCNFFELAVERQPDFLEGKTIPLTSPAAEEALAMMTGLVQKNISPMRVTELDENLSYAYMLDNDAVFVRGWPNFVENYRRFYPDAKKLATIGRAALPHYEGQQPASVFGGWNLMVSKSSAKKEASVEFIRFLQSDHAQRLMFEHGGYLPVVNSLYRDSSLLRSHPELMMYSQLLRRGVHRPVLEEYTRTSDIIAHFVHLAISQEMSVKDALRRADEMIKTNSTLTQ